MLIAQNYSRKTLTPPSPLVLDPDQPQSMESPNMYVIRGVWIVSESLVRFEGEPVMKNQVNRRMTRATVPIGWCWPIFALARAYAPQWRTDYF